MTWLSRDTPTLCVYHRSFFMICTRRTPCVSLPFGLSKRMKRYPVCRRSSRIQAHAEHGLVMRPDAASSTLNLLRKALLAKCERHSETACRACRLPLLSRRWVGCARSRGAGVTGGHKWSEEQTCKLFAYRSFNASTRNLAAAAPDMSYHRAGHAT